MPIGNSHNFLACKDRSHFKTKIFQPQELFSTIKQFHQHRSTVEKITTEQVWDNERNWIGTFELLLITVNSFGYGQGRNFVLHISKKSTSKFIINKRIKNNQKQFRTPTNQKEKSLHSCSIRVALTWIKISPKLDISRMQLISLIHAKIEIKPNNLEVIQGNSRNNWIYLIDNLLMCTKFLLYFLSI